MRRERRNDEQGVTIIEVIVTMALLSIVVAFIFNALWQAQESEQYSRGRTAALDDMRITMNRVTKDLRQVSTINGTPTASTLDVNTYVQGVETRVVYHASGETLTRQVGTGPATPIQGGLYSTDLFSYTPDAATANIVTIDLAVAPPNLPETVVRLHSEIELRNG